jgi:glycosyltransferase involved in cell wall biosynthesis
LSIAVYSVRTNRHGNLSEVLTARMQPYLSVIIPAYNEEKRIFKTLEVTCEYLSKQPYRWEVLIVVDGASDGTVVRVEEFAAGKEGVTYIDRRENRGKGYTVREGMLRATGLFTDADNSTDIRHFDKMKPLFDSGYDVVICSRDSKDAPGARQAVPQPLFKRVLGNGGNLIIQAMAVPGVWDTQCGFKSFTAAAADRIFSISRIDRWGFDMEALALARRFKFRLGIVPAYWIDDGETHVKLSNYADAFVDAVRVRWGLMTGRYK